MCKYLIFVITIFFSNSVLANENIYYIDMDYIMNNSLAGKSIIKQLEDKEKFYSEKFKKTSMDLQKEEAKLISQKNILDEKKFLEKVNIFKKKVSEYKKQRNDTINGYKKKKNEAQLTLINKLNPILSDYSDKKSISFILPKQSIIIGKTELDITNDVIKILNTKIKTIELK